MAYFQLEPWGFEIENYRAALVSSVVANTVRDSKKRRKAFQPEDFMPKVERARRKGPVDAATLRAKIDSAMIAFGGRRKHKAKKES